jgi:tetratricopeptide (TPR) repeat protein
MQAAVRSSRRALFQVVRAIFAVYLFIGLALIRATAQGPPILDRGYAGALPTEYSTAPGTGLVQVSVFAGRSSHQLDRQAMVKLTNLKTQTSTWQTTEDSSTAVLSNVPFGNYLMEVSAVGYVTESRPVDLMDLSRALEVTVILQHDPSALNLDVEEAAMPPKGRKETRKAIAALKSAHLAEAEKHLNAAYTMDPASPELNFLLGYLHFQKNELDEAAKFLTVAAAGDRPDQQALALLGRTDLERHDYAKAQASLEKAIALNGQPWLPHSLLADACLRQKMYPCAREQSTIAMEGGKNAATSAQLILGQALINLNQPGQGIQALEAFLHTSPHSPLAPAVLDLIAEVEKRGATPEPVTTEEVKALPGLDPLSALPKAALVTQRWQPPGIDETKPAVVAGVSCPLDQVLTTAGQRVDQLVEDVARFAAVEELLHQRLDNFGVPVRTETRKFNYVASITETAPGYLQVDEYRADRLSLTSYPDQIASTGFVTLALVFHPHVRDDFQMSCEGLGDWQGFAAWIVHFRQREDRPNRIHSYKVGTLDYPVNLKGRAWIRADNFQIVRMESELVKSMPQIQLLSEHQLVEYEPIQFGKAETALWLPRSAEIYFDFRRQRYYRRHRFDHYMLFAVNSDEHRKEPTMPAAAEAKDGARPAPPESSHQHP